jgi:hypothetical protein
MNQFHSAFTYFCASVQIFVTPIITAFILFFLGENFDRLHSSSTARDPDPSLTRTQVIWDVLIMGGKGLVIVTVVAILIFTVNYWALEQNKAVNRRRFSFGVAGLCWMVMVAGLVG